jgi:hypothetical protein
VKNVSDMNVRPKILKPFEEKWNKFAWVWFTPWFLRHDIRRTSNKRKNMLDFMETKKKPFVIPVTRSKKLKWKHKIWDNTFKSYMWEGKCVYNL